MKDKITLVLATIILVAFFFIVLDYQNKKINVLEANQKTLLNGVDKTIELNHSQLLEYLNNADNADNANIKHVIDSLNIKPRNITKYETSTIFYRDTTILEVPVVEQADVFPFEIKDSCLIVNGYVDVMNNKLIVENRQFSDEVIKINYIKRKPVKWLFGLRIGTKQANCEAISRCGTTSKTFHIDVF
jgi:hypothetical protein